MNSAQTLNPAFKAPSLSLLATEPLRAMFDFVASRLAAAAQPIGDGHPVVVFPGLGGAPFTTSQLRRYLDQAGFQAHDWGRGMNTGPDGNLDTWLLGLVQHVRELHAATGRKVSLVGWSLGGVYAREIAKLCPESVRQVVTLGTPFASLGGANHAGGIYKLLNRDNSVQLTPELQARLRTCPPVPTTSVYSKSDGVVSWRGCLEKKTATSESVEVTASHLGMVTHPEVLRIVANRLAQPEGEWRALRRGERLGTGKSARA
ncbi:MAG: alpha/beta hydrolase [Comamonadaceae bacterium]|nr:MAG: alpha/beta hydrolase [Comamonadaceae bacterium]